MKYTCRKCGATFDLTSETKECEFCGAPIEEKNDESGNLQAVNATKAKKVEEYNQIVELYKQNGSAKDIRKEVQAYDNYSDKDIPNFKKIWRDFIILAAGASEDRNDKELQTFLKNHAREYDNNTPGSSLFLSILQAYPKVGTNNDWDALIQDTYLDSARFSGLCENIVNYIIKAKDKAFAIEIFNSLASKEEKGVEAGRLYIRLLLTTEDVANNVFTVSSFNGKTKKFILAIRKYCTDYLEQGNKITPRVTKTIIKFLLFCFLQASS